MAKQSQFEDELGRALLLKRRACSAAVIPIIYFTVATFVTCSCSSLSCGCCGRCLCLFFSLFSQPFFFSRNF